MPAHDCLFLLRNILAAPRLMYLLRTAPCIDCPVLPLYDGVLRESLSVTLNVDLDDDRWRQASLPVRWVVWASVVLFCLHRPPSGLPPQAPWRSHPPSFQHDFTTSRTAASTPPCLPGYGMHHMFDYVDNPDATAFNSPTCLGRPQAISQNFMLEGV
jgi:hypothetical protein